MEVNFAPEIESRLQQVAHANGKNAEQLVKDTVSHMLERQSRFVDGVIQGIVQANRGEFVDHDEVANRITRLLKA